MKRVSVILVATASTLFLSAAGRRIDPPLSTRDSHLRAEVARLRAHFDSVDTELRTRDVSHLETKFLLRLMPGSERVSMQVS